MSAGRGAAPAMLPPRVEVSPLEPTLRLLRAELERRCPEDAVGLDALERSAMLPPGKLLRPLLFTESAAAAGMRREDTLTAALGIESLHVGSLVHDDVIDSDTLRRGRPTVVARHGTPNAIVTGDALIIGAFRAVAECADGMPAGERHLAVVRTLADAGVDLCRGQVMEDELRGEPGSGLERYLTMVSLKTGALFRAACLGGAQLAGAPPAAQEAFTRFAEHLGRAFQMTDDLLPHISDAETSGKSVLSDIANRRPTFPVLLCWREADEHERGQLSAALGGSLPAEAALETVRGLLASTGALEAARAEALAEASCAKAALLDLPGTAARDALSTVADLSVNRDR
ncbi:polyprenyl synthetase family protein [Streptomyces sp. NBC_01187]|uniref:polyprenyl synthetase family protein n=1 Tax=Streptomyces sp. NBC_01187 TaxID=2903766 RepID=UPI00386B1D28|nr:polyprenyl synthetase family protein [Streptomyces sp. NBC_01187]